MTASLVLASASPQRKTLLQNLGVPFSVVVSGVDEVACSEADPAKRAQTLARLKAADVAAKQPKSWVIGSDTLVVSEDGVLLEKPADADEARSMMQAHSNCASIVHSAVCLQSPDGEIYEALDTSTVYFKQLTSAEIEWWIGTGEWRDRSGAFQIDGHGQLLICRLEGDWTSVVGLPVYALGQLLEQAEAPFLWS